MYEDVGPILHDRSNLMYGDLAQLGIEVLAPTGN